MGDRSVLGPARPAFPVHRNADSLLTRSLIPIGWDFPTIRMRRLAKDTTMKQFQEFIGTDEVQTIWAVINDAWLALNRNVSGDVRYSDLLT